MKKMYMFFFAILLMFCFLTSKSQIQYTYINSVLYWPARVVDINLNAIVPADYTIWCTRDDTTHNIRIRTINYSEVMVDSSNGHYTVKALNPGDVINESQTTWKSPQDAPYFYLYNWGASPHPSFGNWLGVGTKYIGARTQRNGDWYYGWIEVTIINDTTGGNSNIISGFAYEKTPGVGIKANQKVGINDHQELSHPTIYSYGKNIICYSALNENGTLSLYNSNGKLIRQTKVETFSTVINMTDQATGIYFISLNTNKTNYRTKIFLK